MGLLDGVIIPTLQNVTFSTVLIQVIYISEQFTLEHFFILTPGKPAGVAAVDHNPGKVISGAGSLDLIRNAPGTLLILAVHQLINVRTLQRCAEIQQYVDLFGHIVLLKKSSVYHSDRQY